MAMIKIIDEASKSYKCAYPKNPKGKPIVDIDDLHFPFKIISQSDILRKFANGESILPIHIRMGITNKCNMRCNYCNYHSTYESLFYDNFNYNDQLGTNECISFLQEFANNGGKAVTFCGSGESTIHQGYMDICSEAKSFGLKIGLITNGSMLHKEDIASCIARTHTWVRIGMNAGTEKTFEEITHFKSSRFAQILKSITYLQEKSVELDFRVGVNFVITLENYREIMLAATLAKESKADYIRFEPEFYTAIGHLLIRRSLSDIEALLKKAKNIANDVFQVSTPKLDRGKMTKTEIVEGDFKICHYSRFTTAIGADGCIYPCPQVHLGSKYNMGNAMKNGYEAWLKIGGAEKWHNQNKNREDLCKTCYYRPQNELLDLIIRKEVDLDVVISEYNRDHPVTLHDMFI